MAAKSSLTNGLVSLRRSRFAIWSDMASMPAIGKIAFVIVVRIAVEMAQSFSDDSIVRMLSHGFREFGQCLDLD